MRLNDDKEQGLRASLAALKSQHRALARSMEEVRLLLEGLEADDEADAMRTAPRLTTQLTDRAGRAGRAASDRHYGRRQDQTASPQ